MYLASMQGLEGLSDLSSEMSDDEESVEIIEKQQSLFMVPGINQTKLDEPEPEQNISEEYNDNSDVSEGMRNLDRFMEEESKK